MHTTILMGELREHCKIKQMVKQSLQQGDLSVIFVFPTLSLLHCIEEELLEDPTCHGIGGFRFLLFEGFIGEMAERFGLRSHKPTSLQREMILTEAFHVLDETGHLSYLNRSLWTASYRSALLDGIAEWKRAGLTPQLLIQWAADQGEKEQQLALLYYTYQHFLTENGFVEEDHLLEAFKALRARTEPQTNRSRVILYGYTDLTPLQRDFITTLELWFKVEAWVDPTPVPEFGDFIRQHFPFKGLPALPESPQGNALAMLQQSLWVKEPLASEMDSADLSLRFIRADGWNRQATAIAREICALLQSNAGYGMKDFLIICPKPQMFIKRSHRIFAEYRLPLAVAQRSVGEFFEVSQLPQAFQAVENGWQWPDMEELIRQFYAGIGGHDRDRLWIVLSEKYGALSGKQRWLELFTDEAFLSEIAKNQITPEPLQQCLHFLDSIPLQAPLGIFLQWCHTWLETVSTRILKNLTPDRVEELPRYLAHYEAVSLLREACEEMMGQSGFLAGFGPGEMSLGEFKRLFEDYLLQGDVASGDSGNFDHGGIRVIPPREARGLACKVVFITGLEQGVFPRVYVNDWKLTPENRWDLKPLGVELETQEPYLLQEKMAFYWSIQAAVNRVCFIGQEQDEAGQPVNCSSFLETVLQWFPDLKKRAEVYPLEPKVRKSFNDCYSIREESELWTSYLIQNPDEISQVDLELCQARLHRPDFYRLALQVWQWRHRRRLKPETPFSDNPLVKKALQQIYGPEASYAITALEDYRKCPYRFFLKHLLRIKPLISPTLLPETLDLGNLYHQILKEFNERFRGQTFFRENQEMYWNTLETIFQGIFEKWQEQAANDLVQAALSIRKQQVETALRRFLEAELQWGERTGNRYSPRFLEFSFGMAQSEKGDPDSTPKPFCLETPEGRVKLIGRIDRVDTDAEGDYLIYDYKLGKSYTTSHILEYQSIQMPLYMKAMGQLQFGIKQAVGGSYLSIKEPSRMSGGVWRQAKLGMDGKQKALLGESEWQEWFHQVEDEVILTVNAIRSGCFYHMPDACPDYCEYRRVCRKK